MALFPKMGDITAQLNEKFDKLYGILVEIRDLLRRQEERTHVPKPKG